MKQKTKYLFALITLVSLTFFACNKDEDPGDKTEISIEYKVTTTESGKVADIEYTSAAGTQVDVNNESLPWSISFNAQVEAGDALDMTVESASSGNMTAQILIDGEVVETETDDNLIFMAHIIGF